MHENHPAHHLFYKVEDPEATLHNCPAMTTLLHRVCGNDPKKFEESTRIIGLFMEAAYRLGVEKGKTL